MSVRTKLLLLSATPVLVTGTILVALFGWVHAVVSDAYEEALAWQHHTLALEDLDWAARFYVDAVADGIGQDPMSHQAESRDALERARAQALWQAQQFSPEEQAAQAALDQRLGDLVEQGELVGTDRERLSALAATYHHAIKDEIDRRVEEEEAGSALAIRAAHDLSVEARVEGLALALVVLLAAIGSAAAAISGFGRRVVSLEAAAARVAAGDLEEAVPVTSRDELGRLAGSLNAMIEALRRQRTRQLGFLAAVAHDLRNPLSGMRLTTDVLLRSPELPPEPELRRSLALVSRQIERLARLAEDLLEAASIEAGELELRCRACDLGAVARDVTELYATTSVRHELRLSVPPEPVVAPCDPTRIAQVIDNLVNNAIKYSPAGGLIEVTVSDTEDEVVVSVADAGVGIDPGMFEAIFEPFRRLSPSRDVVPGVGLGLSTCRRIVAAHGGRIEVSSKLGRGTTFEVHLPRRRMPAEREHGPDQAVPSRDTVAHGQAVEHGA